MRISARLVAPLLEEERQRVALQAAKANGSYTVAVAVGNSFRHREGEKEREEEGEAEHSLYGKLVQIGTVYHWL